MYFCIDQDDYIVGSGKTLQEAIDDCVDQGSSSGLKDKKFYTGNEIKVELKEVTVTTTKIVQKKQPVRK